MRIAVDARPLASPLTGIGRYTHSLLKRLVQTDHEWFLYSDRPLTTDVPTARNVTVRTGDAAGGTPGSLRWAQWEYVRWAKQDGIDVFWSPRHHLPLLLPQHIRTVVTIHDLVWKRFPETMQRKNYWLERLLMGLSVRKANEIISVSRFTESEILQFFPASDGKIRTIYEAAEMHDSQTNLPVLVQQPYLLFVGTLEPRKNLRRLLLAFAAINPGSMHLAIAGGAGWGNVKLDDLIQELKLEKSVSNLGYVDERTLQSLYLSATALVMPSLYEGFGLPALEAMQYGVPVIVSRGTALEEVCDSAALLVNPESVEDIANAILRMTNSETRTLLAQNAKKRSTKFNWDEAAKRTLDALVDNQNQSRMENSTID